MAAERKVDAEGDEVRKGFEESMRVEGEAAECGGSKGRLEQDGGLGRWGIVTGEFGTRGIRRLDS